MDGLQVRDGVRVNGGGSGWKKSEKKPAWRSCWKGKNPLISFASVHFWKWASNKSTQVKWKTGSTVFRKKKNTHTLSQNRTFPADGNTSWYLPHSISSKRQSVSVANILYDKQNNTWLLVDMYNFSSRVQLDISLICCAPIELNTQRQNSRSMCTHVLFPIYYFL